MNASGFGPALLCFDGSEHSANAIARAGELLRHREALVVVVWSGLSSTLLHSDLYGVTSPIPEATDEIDAADRERAEELAAEGAQLALAAGLQAQPIAEKEHGNTWRTLARCAEKHEASVVVAGARGRSRVASAVLGSVSHGLISNATAPVLVVPRTATGQGAGPLVLCDDGSDGARRAIAAGCALLELPHAAVLRAYRRLAASVPMYLPVVSREALGMAKELDDIVEEAMDGSLAEAKEIVEDAGLSCETEAVRAEGSYWRALVHAADERDAAAAVVGSRGLGGLPATLGSVSQAVANHSRRPVLVVPPAPDQ